MHRDMADIVDSARLAAIYGVPMSVTTDAAIGRRMGFPS
jgi:ferric hydroxamate transport system ATP-binding protein